MNLDFTLVFLGGKDFFHRRQIRRRVRTPACVPGSGVHSSTSSTRTFFPGGAQDRTSVLMALITLPCLPMTLPNSSGCTLTSNRIEPEFSIFSTETASVLSTKDFTSNSTSSFKEPLPFILRPLPYPAALLLSGRGSSPVPRVVRLWSSTQGPSPCPLPVLQGSRLGCNAPKSQ